MRIGPHRGPKEEILNSWFCTDNAPTKALEETVKDKRKPHNTSAVPKKSSEFWRKQREG
jgi:hypothetical protein